MKRFYPLSVDRLEDRWVPSAVTDVEAATAAAQMVTVDVSTDPTAGAVTTETTSDDTQYVIDVYPTDPNGGVPVAPVKPIDAPTAPPEGWSDPTDPVPPIDDPFWH